ncbi:MAG: hypothetical protein HYY15_03665 [Candidatus Omnitrophica bacterium]|nr:hypothetical protein [Candidatus Omnitrophota bacterium]
MVRQPHHIPFTVLLMVSLITHHSSPITVEAAVTKSDKYQMAVSSISEGGGGKLTSSSFGARGGLGETFAGAKASSTTVTTQAGFIASAFPGRRQSPVDQLVMTVLYAKTDPLGSQIPPETWQRDADPIFIWEPPTLGLDLAGYSYAVDDAPDDVVDTAGTSWNVATDPQRLLADGQRTFWVKALSTSGRAGPPISFGVWVDTAPPVIGSYAPAPGLLLNTLAPTVTAAISDALSGVEAEGVTLSVNGVSVPVEWDSATGQLTVSGRTILSEGSNRFQVEATDRVGNVQTPVVWSVRADVTPPSGSVLINGGAQTTTSAYVTLNLSGTDALAGISHVLISNDAVTGYVQEPYAAVRDLWRLNAVRGEQTVYVKFVDTAGNVSEPVEDQIVLELSAPETIIVSGPAGITPASTAKFTFSCPGGNCVFSYAFDHDAWSEWSTESSVTSPPLGPGNHYFKVKAGKETNGIADIQADEEDPTPAERTWIVGVEPPVILVPQGPPIKLWRIE